jgi:hypothetical protein
VAELADAPDLGSGGREAVGVRVSPLALGPERGRRTLSAQADVDRFNDPVERDLGGLASVSDEILGSAAEQEERHPVRGNEDAAEGVDRICRIASVGRRSKTGKCLPDLLLADPRPVALDDKGARGSSFEMQPGLEALEGAPRRRRERPRRRLRTRARARMDVFPSPARTPPPEYQ